MIYREDVPSLAAAVKRLGDESSFVLEETLWSIPERQRERALQFWRGLRAIEGDPTLKTHYIEQKGLLLDSWASTLHNALNVMAYYNTGVLIALGSEHSEGIRTIDRIYREASAKRN